MTLSKLSLRNAKRQAHDYLVYFITIIMATSLIYAFNALVFSEEIRYLSSLMNSLPFVIVLASAVVVAIIGWLVSYTTKFMLTKRSRELGTYILLGVENKQVAKMFFLENLVVGSIAIILGIIVGNIIFQVLRAITLALFNLPYTFDLKFSIKPVLLTLFYFTLIYLFALDKSRRQIKRMKIYELIYFEKQNENVVIKKNRNRQKTFFASIVLGILGMILLLLGSMALGILGAVLIILFLYGFFLSFSSGIPNYYERRPTQKYVGVKLIVFRSLTSKLATMGIIMATVAVLFTATLISQSIGLISSTIFDSRSRQTTSFDLFISSANQDEERFDDYLSYIAEEISVLHEHKYHIYQAGERQVLDYVLANNDYYEMYEYDPLLAFSDYVVLGEFLDYPVVELSSDEYFIHSMPHLESTISKYTQTIMLNGQTLFSAGQIYTEDFTQSLSGGNGYGYILIVPDEALAGSSISHINYAAMTVSPVSEEVYDHLRTIRGEKARSASGGYDRILSNASAKAERASMYALFVYPLFYLSLILMMVATTILTIQLLSESNRYKRHYAVLDNLGMEPKDMKKSLTWQFTFFYTMPALPPVLIAVPFTLNFGSMLDPGEIAGSGHLWSLIGIALSMFLGIYFIYVLAAYTNFKRSVLPK